MHSDDELERFKALNLGELAASYGYELDQRESSRSSLVMRHAEGDKIVIATGEDGHAVFFSVHTNASGSVIDFIMHRQGRNLGYARKTLRGYVPPTSHDRAALVAQWHQLRPYAGSYLESRGLTATTLAAFAERIRLDDREGLTGWEVKNQGFTGFASGGRKALFACRINTPREADPPRLIVAESALDAMSYHQLNPAPALVLSFGGGLSPEQETFLRYVLTLYPAAKVITATDADAQGEHYADLIEAIRPDAIRARPPTGKDWNDALTQPSQAQLFNLSP
ncbi:MAG TPA: toprim domain-containing protein [Methylobacter sp.]|jgi:hypothetical protein